MVESRKSQTAGEQPSVTGTVKVVQKASSNQLDEKGYISIQGGKSINFGLDVHQSTDAINKTHQEKQKTNNQTSEGNNMGTTFSKPVKVFEVDDNYNQLS